jgi:hypothetical protein
LPHKPASTNFGKACNRKQGQGARNLGHPPIMHCSAEIPKGQARGAPPNFAALAG